MKPISLICLLLTGVTQTIFAQHAIKGRIIDTYDYGVAFANVLLLNQTDSVLVKGAVTDADGYYTLSNIEEGNYLIESYMVGFSKSYSPLIKSDGQRDLDMAAIILAEDTKQLDEVVIKADKPLYEMEMGKMVVNVQSSITAAGQTIIDVLEKSPGVTVDRQNNSFALSGKGGVIVLMNGKRSRMPISAVYQLLEGLNASNVEKIEIMTVPPANYDADGDAGMINIITKKSVGDGTNGSIMANAGFASGFNGGGSLNINHQAGKLSLYGNYSYNYTTYLQEFDFYRQSETDTEQANSSTLTDRDADRGTHNFQFGFDYAITDKTIIGGQMGGYDNLWEMTSVSDIQYAYSISPDTIIKMDMNETNHWKNLMGNLNFQHTFRKNQVLTADLDYLVYDNSNPTGYYNQYFNESSQLEKVTENRISKDTPINIWVAKIDYSMNIGKSITLDFGIKGAFSDLINDVVFEEKTGEDWIKGEEFSNYSDLSEDVLAAFGALKIKFDENTSMNAGMRYEYTDTYLSSDVEAGVVDREYGNLFPTLFITRKLNDKNTLQFSYGRRITRPTFNEMAPWVIFTDPYSLMAGNVNILPTITDNFKADYSLKNYIFSLQYSHDQNVIARFQPQYDPATNILITTTENLDRSETVSSTIIFPFQITDWWEMQNNVTGNWQMIETDNESASYKRDIFQFQANTTQTFKLPKKYAIELSGFYTSPMIAGYANILARYMVNLGIQKEFNSSSLRFSINDIFESGYQFRMKSEVGDQNLSYNARLVFQQRLYTLTYTQKFGNNKVKGARKRAVGAQEEMRRVTN